MHKRDYFIQAMKAEAYRYKAWILGAFSVTRQKPTDVSEEYPYQLFRDDKGQYYFFEGQKDAAVYLEGIVPGEPPFSFKDQVVLGVGDVPNLKRNITSTYGNLLFNYIALVYPFGEKIDYMEGPITVPRVEKIIEGRLQDAPKNEADRSTSPGGPLYVDEYMKFNEAMFSMAGLTQLCVPSATAKTMTTDPRIAVRRDELLKQYKDRLHDPVVQAKIDAELIAMDRAWLKGDLGEGFYIKDKSFEVVRKKTHLLQGAEQGFDVQGEVIPTSLNDGWDIKYLPAMGNSLREGSYNRGALTALGGEATKFNYRIFQNTVISEDDCGSTLGMPVEMTPTRAPRFLASSYITPKGPVEITEENLQGLMGQTLMMRTPLYCKTKGANFCAVCMGRKIATTPNAISTYAADIGSTFMGIMLKSMHGKSLSVAKYDYKQHLR